MAWADTGKAFIATPVTRKGQKMTWITRLYIDHPTRFVLIGFLMIVVSGIGVFLVAVFGTLQLGDSSWRRLIEAANYATQTVTTVGYGNMSPNLPGALCNAEERLKFFSSGYTIVAALVWASIVDRALGVR